MRNTVRAKVAKKQENVSRDGETLIKNQKNGLRIKTPLQKITTSSRGSPAEQAEPRKQSVSIGMGP